jgi:NAD+ diphosphatase
MTLPRAGPRSWLLVHPKGLVVRRGREGVSLPSQDDAHALGIDEATAHGIGDSALASSVAEGATLPDGCVILSLREVFAALGDEAFIAAGRASQIVEWAETSRFCGRCGTGTERVSGERATRCPSCALLFYPRIAPAIIVLVRKGELGLLARGARLPPGMFSTLAGFAEPGEELEETLAREVREEVGIEVKDLRYFGSQPWPFPHSLMIGFYAEWAGGDIRVDGQEILEARWFSARELPQVPPPISISRRLIDGWVKDVTSGPVA